MCSFVALISWNRTRSHGVTKIKDFCEDEEGRRTERLMKKETGREEVKELERFAIVKKVCGQE